MSALPSLTPSDLEVVSRRPARVSGVGAVTYRLRRPYPYTGDADLDTAFSTFDAVVIPPADGRSGAPLVSMMNGITKGLDRSIPAAVAASKAGLGAVLIDTPLGGSRRLGAGHPGTDLAEIARRGIALDVPLARRLFDGVAADLPAVFGLVEAEHGLGAERRALFGVSFGCLLSSLAFARDGFGDRLFGAIGHPDLPTMSRGLVTAFAGFSGLPQSVIEGGLRLGPLADAAARRYGGDQAVGAVRFARMLAVLGRGGRATKDFNPIQYVSSVSASRSAHFLAGSADPVAPPTALEAAASAFTTSSVTVLPGLGHGWYPSSRPAGAPTFEQACGDWLVRHLEDWTG